MILENKKSKIREFKMGGDPISSLKCKLAINKITMPLPRYILSILRLLFLLSAADSDLIYQMYFWIAAAI
jgi:hypothetical protein